MTTWLRAVGCGFNVVVSTGAVLFLCTACETTTPSQKPLAVKVIRLKGAARYSCDDGNTWKPIQLGSELEAGCLIQTGGDGSKVVVGFGYRYRPVSGAPRINIQDPRSFPINEKTTASPTGRVHNGGSRYFTTVVRLWPDGKPMIFRKHPPK